MDFWDSRKILKNLEKSWIFRKFSDLPELSCCEFCELRGERRQKMKLSMSSIDSRILFVSGGEVTRSEVHTSSGIFGIYTFGD